MVKIDTNNPSICKEYILKKNLIQIYKTAPLYQQENTENRYWLFQQKHKYEIKVRFFSLMISSI